MEVITLQLSLKFWFFLKYVHMKHLLLFQSLALYFFPKSTRCFTYANVWDLVTSDKYQKYHIKLGLIRSFGLSLFWTVCFSNLFCYVMPPTDETCQTLHGTHITTAQRNFSKNNPARCPWRRYKARIEPTPQYQTS